MSCSHGQELSKLADLASDWLFTANQEPASLLTQLLRITVTHKIPSLVGLAVFGGFLALRCLAGFSVSAAVGVGVC